MAKGANKTVSKPFGDYVEACGGEKPNKPMKPLKNTAAKKTGSNKKK